MCINFDIINFDIMYNAFIKNAQRLVTMKRGLLFIMLAVLSNSVAISQGMEGVTMVRISDPIYTGSPLTPAITLKDGVKPLRLGADYTVEYKNNVNAGTATILIKGLGNYSGSLTKEFNIKRSEILVTPDPGQRKKYGSPDPKFTYKVMGNLRGNDVLKGELTRDPGENVNSYEIKQGTLSAGENYKLVVKTGVLFSIDRLTLKIKANPGQSKIYGEPDPPTYKYSVEGTLIGKDAITGEMTRQLGENVASYPYQQGSLSAGSNYNIDFTTSTFEVKKTNITIKVNPNQNKTYGSFDPPFTYVVSEGTLLPNDVIRGTLARQPGEDVGKYPISRGTLGINNNYNIKFETTDFEILPKSFRSE